MRLLTAGGMREADLAAAGAGVPTLSLMDRAGERCADLALRMMGDLGLERAVAVCGPGNNGGDGLATALHLKRRGALALAVLLRPADCLKGDPAAVLLQARKEDLTVTFADGPPDLEKLLAGLGKPFLLLDALFGTGFCPPAREPWSSFIQVLNGSLRPILAIDLPSGVDADTGSLTGPAVRALRTLTLGAPKPALFIHPAADCAGEVTLAGIGHPPGLLAPGEKTGALETRLDLLESGWARDFMKYRREGDHKGTYGHLLVVAGSRNMPGAAHLAVRGGLRGGAGLVTLAAPAETCASLPWSMPEALLLPLPDRGGGLEPEAAEAIIAGARGKRALVLGPGLGAGPGIGDAVRRVLAGTGIPLVLDADGLNALGGDPSLLKDRGGITIVTPHPGELARLTGVPTDEIQADRLAAAKHFAELHRVITVLKGAGTLVAAPDGSVLINGSGNPGMASGGMGDVLAGLIGSLLAQGYDPLAAAGLAVYLHGLAGDLAAGEIGPWGFTASEVADRVPAAAAAVLSGHEDIETL